MTMKSISCESVTDIPPESHWAILDFSSISIPGDERSRTNPGHGYPAHSKTTICYTAYLSKESWEAEIQKRMTADRRFQRDDWKAIVVQVPVIRTKVSVEIGDSRGPL